MTEKKRLTPEERQVIRLAHTSYLPNKTPLLDPHTEKVLDSERVGWDEVERMLAALEESQQHIDKLELYVKSLEFNREDTQKRANDKLRERDTKLVEVQQTIARQQEALEFLADNSNWSWWNVGTEDETVTWVGGTDPQHVAREALGNKEGSDNS